MISTSGASAVYRSISPPMAEDRQGATPPAVRRATLATMAPTYRPARGCSVRGRLEVDRTRPAAADDVVRVGQRAPVEAETATADAAVQPVPQPLQPVDLVVDPTPPGLRQPVPVLPGRRTA